VTGDQAVGTRDKTILWEAEFNPKVRTYWLLSGALVLLATVVGIPLLPFWFLFGYALTDRYLKHMRCVLTTGTLEVSKGMFVRVEKTVPLDKITDIGLVHGPIMRYYDLRALSVETAGQSSAGALVKLIGVVDTEAFRQAVLDQRDKVVAALAGGEAAPVALPATGGGDQVELLTEIRDAIHRIEGRLPERAEG
jgi:putative membrane protein